MVLLAIFAGLMITGSLFAGGPGRGTIAKYPGGGIHSITIKYNISQIMGEPTVNGSIK